MKDAPTSNAVLSPGAPGAGTPALDEDAFRRFAGHSFVERRAEGGYRAHDLVRRAQLAWLCRMDVEALTDFARRAEAHYRARYQERSEPDDLAEALYHRCWHDEEGAIEVWEAAVEAHTLVADRERWRGVVRALEGPEWAEKPLNPETIARYGFRRGRWHYYNAEWDAALGSYEQALGLFRQVGSRLGEANTYLSLAMADGSRDRIEDMHANYQRALSLYQAIDDLYSLGRALVYYGDALLAAGDEEGGKRRYAEALRAWQARGLDDLIGQYVVPRLACACGSVEAAEAYLRGVSG